MQPTLALFPVPLLAFFSEFQNFRSYGIFLENRSDFNDLYLITQNIQNLWYGPLNVK